MTELDLDNILICYNAFPLFTQHVLDYNEHYYTDLGVKRLHSSEVFDVSDIEDGDYICVKTDFIKSGDFYRVVFPRIDKQFHLVTAMSSYSSPCGPGVSEMLESDRLLSWGAFHINSEYAEHPKVYPLPIGFTEPSRENGDQEMLRGMRENRIAFDDKSDTIFLPHHDPNTNTIRRSLLSDITNSSLPIVHQSGKLPIGEYLSEMDKHKYVICLEGSGIDTHRVYECLLLDCVPIMKRTPLETLFVDFNLPGIFVDSWDELDDEFFSKIESQEFSHASNGEFLLAKTHIK
jgi:hypothetical protein